MNTENNKDRQGILPGIPAHVANYHPAWMNDLGKKSNPRLSALMQRLAQEQVASGKSREEVPKATQSDVCPPAELSVDQSAALLCGFARGNCGGSYRNCGTANSNYGDKS